jgi:hypothetical protein
VKREDVRTKRWHDSHADLLSFAKKSHDPAFNRRVLSEVFQGVADNPAACRDNQCFAVWEPQGAPPMMRYALSAVFAILLCTFTILAKDYMGVIKSIDPDKNTITVTVKMDDKETDKTFKFDKDTKWVTKKKGEDEKDLENGPKSDRLAAEKLAKGKTFATVSTDDDEGKPVKKVRLGGGGKGK